VIATCAPATKELLLGAKLSQAVSPIETDMNASLLGRAGGAPVDVESGAASSLRRLVLGNAASKPARVPGRFLESIVFASLPGIGITPTVQPATSAVPQLSDVVQRNWDGDRSRREAVVVLNAFAPGLGVWIARGRYSRVDSRNDQLAKRRVDAR